MLWLDEYERAARLAPGLLALLPVPILLAGFGIKHNAVVASVISVIVAAGAPLIVAKYVRDRGRSLQLALYAEWGGAPTTLLLVPQDPDDSVQAIRRAKLESVAGVVLPATHDPASAQLCEAAVSTLRQRTNDHSAFPLVFAENKNYGFERNLLAVRSEALGFSVAGLAVSAAGWAAAGSHHLYANVTAVAVGAIANLALMIFWLTWPTKARVRAAGDLYAAQLLDASSALAN